MQRLEPRRGGRQTDPFKAWVAEDLLTMRLEDVSVALLERTVHIYLKHAWGAHAESRKPPIKFGEAAVSEVLAAFADETRPGGMRHFTLRLGNRRYPFMKLALEEPLLSDVFCFRVDTHDQLEISTTTPDYAEWEAIKTHNKMLQTVIEDEWHESGVPVMGDLMGRLESQEVPEHQFCQVGGMPLIHVVDDDQAIAHGVRIILGRRRFAVEVSHSAEEAMTKLPASPPDLVLSDLEMGHGDNGLEFCRRLKHRHEFKRVPFVLATAAGIDVSREPLVNHYLPKPFNIDALMVAIHASLRAAGRQ